MTKYKHIIKYNLIIFFVIYLAIAIWSFLDKQIHMDELINSLYGAILLIIGIIPTGFAFTLVLITLQKKIMLDWLYKKRTNGRYSITQGGCLLSRNINLSLQHQSRSLYHLMY